MNTLYQPWLNLVKGRQEKTISAKYLTMTMRTIKKKTILAEKLQVVARVSYKHGDSK